MGYVSEAQKMNLECRGEDLIPGGRRVSEASRSDLSVQGGLLPVFLRVYSETMNAPVISSPVNGT
uniref:Uncharacterized protein n=1 Tax=Candidatus Nitrotoga fabula TaxID=2182327 RepID=A0A2X0QTY4_9PROT|nr:protein of unknown function [Candidatus Nitrotoga fabula]